MNRFIDNQCFTRGVQRALEAYGLMEEHHHQLELVKDGRRVLDLASREAAGLDKQDYIRGGSGEQSTSPGAGQQAGNGPQTGFMTGATRSTSEGKVDYEGHISPFVLDVFGEYMNAHRVQRDGRIRASDNWQQGIPIYRYVKSLIRHTFEFWKMWRGAEVKNIDAGGKPFTFREVLSAILFNVMGIIFEMDNRTQGNRNPDRLLMPWLDLTRMAPEDRQRLEKADQEESTVDLRQKSQVVTRMQVAAKEVNGFRAGTANPIPWNPATSPGGCASEPRGIDYGGFSEMRKEDTQRRNRIEDERMRGDREDNTPEGRYRS